MLEQFSNSCTPNSMPLRGFFRVNLSNAMLAAGGYCLKLSSVPDSPIPKRISVQPLEGLLNVLR